MYVSVFNRKYELEFETGSSPFSARLRNTHCMDIRYEKYMLHKIELKKVDDMRSSQFHIPGFSGQALGR